MSKQKLIDDTLELINLCDELRHVLGEAAYVLRANADRIEAVLNRQQPRLTPEQKHAIRETALTWLKAEYEEPKGNE